MVWGEILINICICEDEKNDQELLLGYLNNIFKDMDILYSVEVFSSGEELLENYSDNIDLILLDIQMEGLNGMDTARKIREIDKKVEIIFTTSLVEYVLEGYEVGAYRYLLKPIKYEDLKINVSKCIEEINLRNKYIIIHEQGQKIKIDTSEITYIEVQKEDLTIHKLDKAYNTKGTMKGMEKEINSLRFFRCHKSYLVNLEYIRTIKQYIAILENKEEVPISRYRFKETKEKFFDLIGDKLC